MALILIKRSAAGVVYFEPSPADLDSKSDFAVWSNLDPEAEHQPTMKGKPENYWMDYALPKFVTGENAATSPAINLNGPAASSLTYVDGLDTSVEGTINFVNTVLP